MTPGDWQRLEAWFAEAGALTGPARADYLRARHAEDAALAHELDGLLAAQQEAEAAFAQPIVPQLAAGQPPPRAGEWELQEIIGEGGLGVVRRARRGAETGAVKYVHAGYDSGAFRARFLKEQTILRSLDHPAIARLLDGGVDEAGRPDFVMEFIEGQAWDAYLAQARPPLAGCARLFAQLVDAVAYLHGRAVVHGDLKPSNVMVTASGQVKLLDFGAARWLDSAGLPVESTFTRAMLTPGWASPEQTAGGACTALSDIYSLGLLLRQALAGSADTDLAAIAARAAREEPAERYASALALREDLEAYRLNRPVAARRGNRRYAARKLARRHRVALALAAVLACVAAAWLIHRQQQHQRQHQLQAALRETMRPSEAIATVVAAAAANEVASPDAQGQVDMKLLLGFSQLKEGKCVEVEAAVAGVPELMKALPDQRARDIARMRLALLRGLCLPRLGRRDEGIDLLDEGFRLRERLGLTEAFLPQFTHRLGMIAQNTFDAGSPVRGARIAHWAVTEAVRSGDATGAGVIWLQMLRRLRQSEDAALLAATCRTPLPSGLHDVASQSEQICSHPASPAEEVDAAEAELAQAPNAPAAMQRALQAHQDRAVQAAQAGQRAEARGHLLRRLALLEKLVEAEPDVRRWKAMLERSRERMRKQSGEPPAPP
ncbi:MAG: serine/threonine protein kinase [Bryobacterales bacterium]|nr:serine/threonine protein kinase [Bryobacterales bacterium]